VITFNYDVAADLALTLVGLPPWYGFTNEERRGDAVPLLKLHGSISWAVGENGIERLSVGKILQETPCEMMDAGLVTWPISPNLRGREPVIVPPTWNKSDSHKSVADVWSAAANELSNAENIFVIGYSMPLTDAFFRHLYALGTVGTTTLRRFWVFNPNQEIKPRFRDLLGPAAEERFEFNPGGNSHFGDAIVHIATTFPGR
jgi:hypothetical protein